jgi:hypothetical protein
MLRITHVEEIEALLLLLPNLVRQQEHGSGTFAREAAEWLVLLENAFGANRLYQAGHVAMLRSDLAIAKTGQVPNDFEFRGLPSRSRVLNAVASRALQRAADLAGALVAENRPRLVEGERVAHQITAVALSRGLNLPPNPCASNTESLRAFRRNLGTSADLENAAAHLEGLVGPHDTLVLLDRAMSSHRAARVSDAIPEQVRPDGDFYEGEDADG